MLQAFLFFFLAPAIFLFRLDIDECTTNVHNCDPLAVCSNTVGSFHCTCIAGYKGNGTTCVGERCFRVQVTQVGVACRSLWQCTDRFKDGSFLCSMQLIKSFIGTTCTIKLFKIHARSQDSIDIDGCAISAHNCHGVECWLNLHPIFILFSHLFQVNIFKCIIFFLTILKSAPAC